MEEAEKEKLLEMIRELARAYFVERDYAKLLKYMSPQVSWIGTGVNEICCNIREAVEYLKTERELYGGNFVLSNEWYHVAMITDDMVCAMATMNVDADPAYGYLLHWPLRFSAILVRSCGDWYVCHLHNSLPYSNQGNEDFFDRGAAKSNYHHVEKMAADLAAAQVEAARYEDVLTGILNAEGFVCRGRELCSANPTTQYALVKFKINHFRYLNQTCGYPMGNSVLQNIAANLAHACTEQEICARIENDNFVLLAVYRSEHQMDERMNWLDENLLSQSIRDKLQIKVSFTGGIYLPEPGSGEEIRHMIDKAFMALKSVVHDERQSRYSYFNPQAYEQSLYQARLIEEATGAMQSKHFRLYVQPQIDLKTGRLVGGEALVRWMKPGEATIMPGDFIPLFEQSELILEFDFYMLELLCRQIRQWLDSGLDVVPISINQSRRHLGKQNYLERFCNTLDRYEVPHHFIILELTESTFVENGRETLALAKKLHDLNLRLAIDDFGTGYSTLSFFATVEADILKVDRSLLLDIDKNPRGRAVLKTVVALAREGGMEVVCEGVETVAQVEYLRELGCDVAQGFYFAQPMSAEQFELEQLRENQLISV